MSYYSEQVSCVSGTQTALTIIPMIRWKSAPLKGGKTWIKIVTEHTAINSNMSLYCS